MIPQPHKDEKILKISLGDFGHFDRHVIEWEAVKIGIKGNFIAYRLVGHEYQQEQYGPVPYLIFAVIKVHDFDSIPEGWYLTGE